MEGFAPIVIPVYKRLGHLKVCINSLLSNELAKNTELYVYSDNAFSEEDKAPIDELRIYLKSLSGFKRVVIKEQFVNKGLDNIREAIIATLKLHKSIIYLEEDLEVSEHFLRFMNDQLTEYKNDPKVFSISGYSLPCFIGHKEQILGSSSFTAWGCGLWRDKYEELDRYFQVRPLLERMSGIRVAATYIVRYGFGSFIHIRKKLYKGLLTPDITIGTYLWLTNKIQLFPVKSLVNTRGFDGSGWHCNETEKYATELINLNYSKIKKVKLTSTQLKTVGNKVIAFHQLGLQNELIKFMRRPLFYLKKFIN